MRRINFWIMTLVLSLTISGYSQTAPTFSVAWAKKSQDSIMGITNYKLSIGFKLTNVSSIKSLQYYLLNQSDSVIHTFNRIDLVQHSNGFYYFIDSSNKRFTLFNDELNIAEIINSSYYSSIKKIKVEMKDVANSLSTNTTVVTQ